MRWPGLHAVPFPEIINAVDKKTNLKISFSVPAIKSLTIRFTGKYAAITSYQALLATCPLILDNIFS